LDDPWDWESFGWGLLGGVVTTMVVGGVILYFTWPYLVGGLRAIPVFSTMVEEAKKRGLLG
jgi:hypothetical protein